MGFLICLLSIGLIGWACYFTPNNKWVRWALLSVVGISNTLLLLFGGAAIAVVQGHLSKTPLPKETLYYGYLLLAMSIWGWSIVIPWTRQKIAQFLPGINGGTLPDIYLLTLFGHIFLIQAAFTTVLYNPALYLSILKNIQLTMSTAYTLLGFIALTALLSGCGIAYLVKDYSAQMGLDGLSKKQMLLFIGIGLALIPLMQGLENVLLPLHSPQTREILTQITHAFKLNTTAPLIVISAAVLGLFAGIGEEILCRGFLQPKFGLVLTALFFVVLHVHYGPTWILLELFAMAMVLGVIRQKVNTTAAIITHASFDFFVIVISNFFHL